MYIISVRSRVVKVGDPNRNLHVHDFYVNMCYIETNKINNN